MKAVEINYQWTRKPRKRGFRHFMQLMQRYQWFVEIDLRLTLDFLKK